MQKSQLCVIILNHHKEFEQNKFYKHYPAIEQPRWTYWVLLLIEMNVKSDAKPQMLGILGQFLLRPEAWRIT